jgi:hypothetical protein
MPSAGLGPIGPKPLRPYARAYASRGLRALASLSMARSGREGVDDSYVSRMVNLTTLAPRHRRRHPGRDTAAGGDAVRVGGGDAIAVGGTVGETRRAITRVCLIV